MRLSMGTTKSRMAICCMELGYLCPEEPIKPLLKKLLLKRLE
jgi:hypothetical protein